MKREPRFWRRCRFSPAGRRRHHPSCPSWLALRAWLAVAINAVSCRWRSRRLPAAGHRHSSWLLLLSLSSWLGSAPVHALDWEDLWWRADQQAARRFAAGDAAGAADRFADPAWRAAAGYRSGDPQRALDAISGLSGLDADYNRGNALARLGRLEEARAAYESVLRRQPEHEDARHNLELVRRLLEQSSAEQDAGSGASGAGEARDAGERGDTGNAGERGSPGETGQAGNAGEGGERGEGGEAAGGDPEGIGEAGDTGDAGKSGGGGKAAGRDSGETGDAGGRGQRGARADADADAAAGDSSAAAASGNGRDAGISRPPDRPGPEDLGAEARQAPEGAALSSDTGDSGESVDGKERTDIPPARLAAGQPPPASPDDETLTPQERERLQSLEARLRRVPDDPSALLRQRFLLQHLRREGRLP